METEAEEMMMKKHRGAKVKDGGVIVKDEDYTGKYALRVLTEHDEEFEFVLREDQLEALGEQSRQYESEDGLLTRLLPWK